MALPVGILVAVYLNEFAPASIRNGVSLVLDILNGVPAIVIGIFVFGLLVVGHGQSGIDGAFALACLMLPLVARATMEVLALVPNSLREAGLGLGIPQWRTTLSIVLPQTVGGIVTGTVLAVARVAGETAPLLFTSSLVGTQTSWNPYHALQTDPGGDLRALRVARPGRSCARVGRGARAAALHPDRQPGRPLARDPQPRQDARPLMEGDEDMSTTIEPTVRVETTRRQPMPPRERLETIFHVDGLDAIYSGKPAVKDVTMEVYKNLVTAIIGPSGCGKSTYIRCFNRMNDLIPGFTQTGTIRYHGQDISGSNIDPVAVRRNIGMVFQRPNPFPEVDPRQRRLGPEGARDEGRPRRHASSAR